MSASLTRHVASRLGRTIQWASFAVLISSGASAYSQPVNHHAGTPQVMQHNSTDHAVGLRIGNHGSYRTASIFWQSPTWWSHRFDNGWGQVDLLGELSLTHWDARHGRHSSMGQAGAAAFLRWWPSEKPFFLEAGFGPTFITQTRFADYGLSTALQFGSHVGVGYVFNKRHQISLRGSHFSNARIKRPNDGLNLLQLEYAIRF